MHSRVAAGNASARQPALDGVRGLAIAAVLCYHASTFLPATQPFVTIAWLPKFGWMGVDLFFALSGFLITRILLASRGRADYYHAFFTRRALRIFPLYFAVLVAVTALGVSVPALRPSVPPLEELPLFALFVANVGSVWRGWPATMLSHFWSLHVEEQFYVVWPFAVGLLSRRAVAWIAIAFLTLSLAARSSYVARYGPAPFLDILSLTRYDAIFAGAVAAVAFASFEPTPASVKRSGIAFAVAFAAFFVVEAFWFPADNAAFSQTIGRTLLAIAFGSLAYYGATASATSRGMRFLQSRALGTLGTYSYGIYVYHIPLLTIYARLVRDRLPPAQHDSVLLTVAGIACTYALTFGVAKVSFERFERPILALRPSEARLGEAVR